LIVSAPHLKNKQAIPHGFVRLTEFCHSRFSFSPVSASRQPANYPAGFNYSILEGQKGLLYSFQLLE
jgi:hypothetical protein